MPASFGQRLRQDRLAADLTIRQLASAASIDFTYVSKIETGAAKTRLSLEVVRSLASSLGSDEVEYFRLSGLLPVPLGDLLSCDQSLEFVRSAAEQDLGVEDWIALQRFLANRLSRKPRVSSKNAVNDSAA